MQKGLTTVMEAPVKMSSQDSFQKGMCKAFILTGQVQDPDRALHQGLQFHHYTSHQDMRKMSEDAVPRAMDSLGDLISQLSFTERDADNTAPALFPI